MADRTAELVELERLMRQTFSSDIPTVAQQAAQVSSLELFEYTPLNNVDSIRLIKLKRGYGAATLHMSLFETSLQGLPQYEALSYVWGDPKRTHNIFTESSCLPITRSLHEALLRLRSVDSDRLLWIDAICINQVDDGEKSRQVLLMPKIYREATQVLCWLGEDDKTESAWRTIQLIKKLQTINFDLSRNVLDKETWLISQGLPPRDHRAWVRYVDFWARAYFQRMWIIQEIVNARVAIFVIGRNQVFWSSVISGMRSPIATSVIETHITQDPFNLEMVSKRESANNGIRNFISIAHLKEPQAQKHLLSQQTRAILAMDDDALDSLPLNPVGEQLGIAPIMHQFFKKMKPLWKSLESLLPPEEFNRFIDASIEQGLPLTQISTVLNAAQSRRLPDLLEDFEASKTSDPRDRLFALLSLSSDCDNTLLKPDYSESSAQVMMRYASFFIEQEGLGVKLLASAGCAYRADFGDSSSSDWLNTLPSWIPDWMKTFLDYPGALRGHQIWSKGSDTPKFFAASSLTSVVRLLPDKVTLSVRGSVFDTISCVIHKMNADVLDVRAALVYWWQADTLVAEKYADYPFSTRSGRRESMQELQQRTLIADFDVQSALREQDLVDSYDECRAILKRMRNALNMYEAGILSRSQFEDFQLSIHMEQMHNVAADYYRRWSALSVTHDLVGTRRGLIGLVPHGAVVGDSIALVNGASFPYIIRQAGSTTEPNTGHALTTYQLIGGAYMHGIMQGELVRSDWWKEENIALV